MSRKLDLSIIVPAFNAELTVAEALHSTFPLLDLGAECLVVDDGSLDGTSEIVQAIARMQPSVRYIHQSNGGLSSARNAGLLHASGRWLTFLDSDDRLEPSGILEALSAAERLSLRVGKSVIVSFDSISAGEPRSAAAHAPTSPGRSVETTAQWLMREWGGLVGAVYRNDLLEGGEAVFSPVPFAEDLVFTFSLAARDELYVRVPTIGYHVRTSHPGQMTSPASRLRLEVRQAFEVCEDLAVQSSPQVRGLYWQLIQKYRWSQANHVAPELRRDYRRRVRQYSRGLRKRLRLRRSDALRGIAQLALSHMRSRTLLQ